MKTGIGLARSWKKTAEMDVRELVKYVGSLRAHNWRQFIGGANDWSRFCREVIEAEPDFIKEMEDGVRVLERRGHKGPITKEQAMHAARTVLAANAVGVNQYAEGRINNENIQPSGQGGTSRTARVARLKRDHPDIAQRLAAGEFKSVAAAVRAARGEDPHPPRRLPPALELAKRAYARLDAAERQEFKTWIKQQAL